MRLDPDCKRGDEWPNLSELNGVHTRRKSRWRTVAAILVAWTVLIALIAVLFLLLLAIVTAARR